MNIDEKNIIFIAGIHGVGKSTLCNKLSQQMPFEHLTASKVIKEYLNGSKVAEDKNVKNIAKNQDALIEGLSLIETNHELVLLDGHFVLLNQENSINKIPLDTYNLLSLKAITILIDTPQNIKSRIDKRDNKDYDLQLLEKMQNAEREYGYEVSKKLDIPYLEIDYADSSALSKLSNFVFTNI